jgi:hypothetical protein
VGIYGPLTLDPPEDAIGSEWPEKAVTAYRTLLASPEQSGLSAARSVWSDTADHGGNTGNAGPERPASITQAAWDAMDQATRLTVANSLDVPPF